MQHNFEGLDRPGGVARVGLLRPLRSRDFRLLWAGMTVSLVGDGVFLVAIAWTAYSLWNTPAALSIVGIAMTVPMIACLLFGGVISDRFDRRRILLYADLGRGLVVGAARGARARRRPHLRRAGGDRGGLRGRRCVLHPCVRVDRPRDRPSGRSCAGKRARPVRPADRVSACRPGARGCCSSALVGVGGAFALDAASFLVSAITVLGLRPAGVAHPATGSTIAAVTDGLRFVRRNVWLWGTLLSAAVSYLAFLGPTEALLPFVVKNTLHGSATDLGLVFAAGGIGAVGAAVFMGQRGQPRRDMTFMYVCWTVATLAVVGYGVARTIPQLMVACLTFNALEAAGTIMWSTVKQRHVPSGLLGRVSSLDWLISISLLPVSFAITGPVAGLVGVRATLVGAGLIGAAATLSALFLPGMRSVEGSIAPPGPATSAPA